MLLALLGGSDPRKGAQLSLQWPHLDLQVAGLIGVAGSGETTSTSNIEDAKDGQRWVLTQEPGEALRIAPASEQASGCDINLCPRPFLCVAVVPKRVEREGRVDRSQMSRHEPWALSLGASNPLRATAPSSARTPPPAGSASPSHRSLVSSSPGAVFRLTLLR
ncbi:hypothetical protein HNV28_04685 [Myxococcus xanthus]|uniref:Uncharacterized protein n=1 Tax=Myxococcus xanthus TaxID=34 RepID=A0A7Y4IE74_MYXXA|nr:hypothetical protein [Myxococcus xanthus]NOJ90520.1 hypothetical protein [Myxococcus xanthus]